MHEQAPRPNSPSDTHQRIVSAAARVFARQGLSGATTRVIAEEAGVNEVTLFRHFRTKDRLLAAVVGANFSNTPDPSAPIPAVTADLDADLLEHARRYSALLTENLPLVRTMIGEIHHRHRDQETQVFRGIFWPIKAAIRTRIEIAQQAGDIDSAIRADILADLFGSMIFTGVLRREAPDLKVDYPADSYLKAAVDLVVRGARRGVRAVNKHALYGSDESLLSPTAAALARKGTLKWVIAITAALGAILEIIDTSIVNVAMPEIQGNLGATLSEAGWVSTGYACANVVMIPLAAWLSDRFGRKQYLLFSLVGFTLASVLCGMATSLSMLIVARVLQGLCGGGLLAKAQSILFETFPREEQPAAQAIFGIGVIAGPALGPVLGGYLTDTFGWRWIFFINLPVGIIAVLMTIWFLPRDRVEDLIRKSVDWAGIGLLTLGLACFQTLLEEGQQEDWFSSRFIVTMAIGAAVGLALFTWRLTTPHPAVDLRVLKHRSLAAGSIYSLILGMGLYGVMFAVPIFLQIYLGFTALQSGMTLFPGAIASAFMMVVMGKIAGRFDARMLICCGAIGMTATALLLAHINPNTGTQSLFFPLVLRGLATVTMFLPLSLATLGPLPKRAVAAGSGFYNLTRQMGSSIGIAIITTILAHRQGVHRAVLVERITAFSPETTQRLQTLTGAFTQSGADPVTARHQAFGVLDRIVNGQSLLLSFADVFRYVAIAFVVTLPLLFLLGRGGNKDVAEAAH